jgi:hypothetical protein
VSNTQLLNFHIKPPSLDQWLPTWQHQESQKNKSLVLHIQKTSLLVAMLTTDNLSNFDKSNQLKQAFGSNTSMTNCM